MATLDRLVCLFHRDGCPVTDAEIATLSRAAGAEKPCRTWRDGSVGFAQSARSPYFDPQSGLALVLTGRIDNRAELERDLHVPPTPQDALTLDSLVLHAYRQWGADCPARIYGDWAFAVWHTREHRLFLARDHYGRTGIHIYSDPHRFAFATDPHALLALDLAPVEMDEFYLAQILISAAGRQGERTIYQGIRRLPPAHHLTVDANRSELRRYWRAEETPELRLPRRQDYVEAFREVFDGAVRANLADAEPNENPDGTPNQNPNQNGATGYNRGRIATTLSAGLDSSAVTATAAGILREQGERLAAFTSTPLYEAGPYIGQRLGNELPAAQAVCRQAGNVDLHAVEGRTLTPIRAMRHALDVLGEPGHAACSFYWLVDLQQAAAAQGCRVLLIGQSGNGTISWLGDPLSQPLGYQLRRLGWRRLAQERLKRALPPQWIVARRRRRIDFNTWCRATAIHPDFARRLNLLEHWLDDPDTAPARTALEYRMQILQPSRATSGARHALMGAAHGVEIRDPTGDARVLAFTLSVPDHIFIDPETGWDRWLIRAAMEGRVPDEVRFSRQRGIQAADLVPRLRASAHEVEAALAEIAQGPAARYVDVEYMREVWKLVAAQDTPLAFHQAVTILTRGIMAGLFVNQFYGT
jgi:asparagine synthase (glutamine-hydrolysing)